MDNIISVVVPVYNVEAYLAECIESIINQTFSAFELILVNDGSTDSSGRICDKYAQTDRRITVIHQENNGVAHACRTGIENSSGEYYVFVDSDDWIEADMLENLYMAAKENCSEVVLCHAVRELEGKSVKREMHSLKTGKYDRKRMYKEVFPVLISDGTLSGKAISVDSRAAKLIQRDLIRNNLCYYREDISNGEDYQLILPAILDAQSIYAISDYYPYHYRKVSTSITQSYIINMWERMEILSKHIEYINEEKAVYDFYPQILREFLKFAILSINNEFRHRDSGLKGKQKIRIIKNISNNQKLRKALDELDIISYSRNRKILLCLIKYRQSLLIYLLKSIQSAFFLKEG